MSRVAFHRPHSAKPLHHSSAITLPGRGLCIGYIILITPTRRLFHWGMITPIVLVVIFKAYGPDTTWVLLHFARR